MMKEKGPRPISEAMSELISLRGIARIQGNAELRSAWKAVAGENFVSQTRVIGLKRGVLQIGVSNAPALSELASFHKNNILSTLKKEHSELKIRDIKFLLRTNHRSQ